MESAVSMETVNVIWESATFDAVSVRLSAQRHGVRTDASTRYEKSLDPLRQIGSSTRPHIHCPQFSAEGHSSDTGKARQAPSSEKIHSSPDVSPVVRWGG